ncbi:bifunctional diguanylate cyclase/phosphodiesterase [Comamonas flocculans]|uniref:bifunctional diguanylate cyclase/phosphodiesterase n=1 Tax=Comamonas flocculans TaxID=2597701 RepID=UPI0016450B5F|nr:EAL domain-containing protein [Comamonas flocculans]
MLRPIELRYLGGCAAAAAVCVLAALFPQWSEAWLEQRSALGVHLFTEVFSLAMMLGMAALAWNDIRQNHGHTANVVLFGWVLIAALDTMSLFSFEGMPGYSPAQGMTLTFFYHTLARTIEAVYLFYLALLLGFAGRRLLWLAAALVLAGALGLLGLGAPALPLLLYTPQMGAGMSATGLGLQLAGIALCLVSAVLFLRHWRQRPLLLSLQIAAACFVLALSRALFIGHFGTLDGADIAAWLLRASAYALLYGAWHQIGVAHPHQQLLQSQRTIARQTREILTAMAEMPVEVVLLDPALNYHYANPAHTRRTGMHRKELAGTSWLGQVPYEQRDLVLAHLRSALRGQHVHFDLREEAGGVVLLSLDARAAPRLAADGSVEGVLLTLVDNTEQENTRLMTRLSLQEAADLKAALDAHAIVAVSNAEGTITQVNDKFCEISGYRRDELIGHTYARIRSGMHPPSFDKEISQAVEAGQVWTGEICNRARDGSLFWTQTTIVPFTRSDGAPQQYITLRTDITERKASEQQAREMALYDELTGLPNRRLIVDHVQQACTSSSRSGSHSAVMLLDLDNFKEVNDTQGHDQGDELLRCVARRLQRNLRTVDMVARLGGDEFVILVNGLSSERHGAGEEALAIGEKVRAALERAFNLGARVVHTSASMGLSLFQGTGTTQDDILKRADMALYRAKARGRNQICLFDPSMQTEVEHRASLMSDLRMALSQGELQLHYQVIVDRNRQPIGYEALLRWQHPLRGEVPPLAFIEQAEQSGLILPIGTWVLQTACRQLAEWALEPAMRRRTVSVNISARQLRDPDFVGVVRSILDETGASAHLLCLELTESMFHEDMEQSIAKMQQLCARGVRFALDDFGTGYSSLGYLRRMPLDIIKIDKSFVDDILTDPNDAAIAQTIMALAGTLELRVIAEGIEAPEQFEWLRSRHCDGFQGYHFGRPVPAQDLQDAAQAL